MATGLNVNGKIVKRPGVYAFIQSGIQNPPLNLSYGNVCIIDDGLGAGFGGGSGVNGEFKSGKDSIYDFTSIQDFQGFAKGGELWNLAQPLFKPIKNNPNINGISKLTFIRACTTTAATTTVALTNGTVVFKTKDEGVGANGALTGSILTGGYGAILVASPSTANRYRLQIYHGNFKGLDPLNNAPYDSIAAASTKASLVIESPDVRTVGDLAAWMQTDVAFNQGFTYVSSEVPATTTTTTAAPTTTTTTTGVGTTTSTTTTTTTMTPLGIIVSGDVTGTYFLASGGTESYGAQDFTDALNAVKDADNVFFLLTRYGSEYNHANNEAIFDFVTSGDSKYEKFVILGGGKNKAEYTTYTYDASQFYDNDNAIVVHGQALKTSRLVGGFTVYSQLHKSANVLGRICGLEPQVGLSFKLLDYDKEMHILDDNEVNYALDNGILVSLKDDEIGGIVILQGINTLQNNEYFINEDNTSFSIQVNRIKSQLNKELIINAKKKFFNNQTGGGNRNTTNPADVKTFTAGYLSSRTANDKQDNLILGYRNIVVTTGADSTKITYDFAINGEQNKLLFVGSMYEV